MASYILPEGLQSEIHGVLVFNVGFAEAIDRIANNLNESAGVDNELTDLLLGIIGLARQIGSTLQVVADEVDGLEKLPDAKVTKVKKDVPAELKIAA